MKNQTKVQEPKVHKQINLKHVGTTIELLVLTSLGVTVYIALKQHNVLINIVGGFDAIMLGKIAIERLYKSKSFLG